MTTKPSANGVNQFTNAALRTGTFGSATAGRRARRARHGSIAREPVSFAAVISATIASRSGKRVSSSSSLRMFCTVRKPISGRNRKKDISAVTAAPLSARATSTRARCGRAVCCAATLISHLLHFRPPQQPLRQEDQRDDEDRKGGDVLVV